MLRQGVGAFCVCPGARSTPFAVAIYRNSITRAMTQVDMCLYIYMYLCMYNSICMYIRTCLNMYRYIYVYIFVSIYTNVYIYIYICIQVVHDERAAGFYAYVSSYILYMNI
jgi:hypothetical protein